jgi:hypothetical protein
LGHGKSASVAIHKAFAAEEPMFAYDHHSAFSGQSATMTSALACCASEVIARSFLTNKSKLIVQTSHRK